LCGVVCLIRKKIVLKTPEEIVRQGVLEYFLNEFGCPASLVSVEISLTRLAPCIPDHMRRHRVDIVCFSKTADGAAPLLLVECKRKRPSVEAVAQLCSYNLIVQSPVVAMAWPGAIALYVRGRLAYQGALSLMPSYAKLQTVSCFSF
jgi:hypothetical protein